MDINGTAVFNRIFNVNKRIVCLRGGTRSSKSFSLMQVVVLWLWTGRIAGGYTHKGAFSVCRSTFPALRATVLKDFISYMHDLDIYKYISHSRTNHEFRYKDRVVTFFSLDDPHKLRGRAHDYIWINECNDTDFEIFNQAIMRTSKTVYLDYNPTGTPWVRTKIEEDRMLKRKDVHLDISVYTDNPFLSEEMVEEIEGLVHVDKDLYNVYTKGIWVSLKGLIFKDIDIIDSSDIPANGRVFYGCDFGYNDPTVLVKVVINGQDMYIDTLVYKRKMLIDEMAVAIQRHTGGVVYCDTAEPRTIEELKRRGVVAKEAKKGHDSILNGINLVKQHRLHISSRSVESIDELKKYKWAETKEGELLDTPIDKFNHTADAIRYAISRSLSSTIKFHNL